jgi:hypothetical protein
LAIWIWRLTDDLDVRASKASPIIRGRVVLMLNAAKEIYFFLPAHLVRGK